MAEARLRAPPVRHGSFLGRDAELSALADRFGSGARLVTVAGPGGIGKTRLAIEYAARSVPEGATAFADFSTARDADGLFRAMAEALGVSVFPRDDEPDPVGTLLARSGAALVVLDNAEHVTATLAPMVSAWTELATSTRFLVTSRERLRVAGESLLDLGPLDVTPGEDAPSAAVRLFLDRMGGAAGAADLPAVDACARLLEGVPLAIELAAARGNLLSPEMLLVRLRANPVDVLGHPLRGAPPRHTTMRRVLDDSWESLDGPERQALAQLSVFERGAAMADAEAVLHLADAPVLDALQGLRDRSLVTLSGPGPERRIEMFETVRAYAVEKLEGSDGGQRARQRHAEHFVREATSARPDRLAWLARERDNLLAAARRAAEGTLLDPGSLEIDALLALDPLESTSGPFAAHLVRLEAATDRASARGEDLAVEACLARGQARGRTGRYDEAVADLETAVRRAGDGSAVRARALWVLGCVLFEIGRGDEAERRLREALAQFEAAGDRAGVARTVRMLATVLPPGALAEARRLAHRGVTLARELEDAGAECIARHVAAERALDAGDLAAAEDEVRTLARLGRRAVSPHARMIAAYPGVILALVQGRCADAAAGLLDVADRARAIGDRAMEASARRHRGIALFDAGAIEDAKDELRRALGVLPRGHRATLARVWLAAAESADHSGSAAASMADVEREAAGMGEPVAGIVRLLTGHPAPGIASTSFEAMLAARTLEKADAARSRTVARVHPEGRFIELEGGGVHRISRRAVRRLLVALVSARISTPGVATSAADLIRIGWPDERMSPTAARNRLHVSVSLLRGIGLRDLLHSSEDGYWLDPAADFVLASEPSLPVEKVKRKLRRRSRPRA